MASSLEGLNDIVLPDPVSWTPQTVGWLTLLIFVLTLGAWMTFVAVRRHRRNRYRRDALAELERINGALDPLSGGRLATLLKKTALACFPRADVASLSSEAWLQFLDDSYGGNGFTTGPGRVLPTLTYTTEDVSDETLRGLTGLIRQWIVRHRVHV